MALPGYGNQNITEPYYFPAFTGRWKSTITEAIDTVCSQLGEEAMFTENAITMDVLATLRKQRIPVSLGFQDCKSSTH